MSEWHLMRPEWLWCLLPALLLSLLLWHQRGRSGSWSDVIDPELLPLLVGGKSTSRGRNLLPLLLLGWLIAVLAASGPSFQKIPQPVHQKQDALVLVLDLSYSMKSGDLAPSRLDRARQKLLDLLEHRREGQTGLIAYAGDAHIVTPLTDDTPTIANLLPALNPDMMPVPGSDPVAAVAQAVDLLHSAGIRQGRILLVTDGIADKQHKPLLETVSGSGAGLSIMGVGTVAGAPIPLPRGGFLKDEDGTIVMPTLEEARLGKIAAAAGGRYRRMQIDDSDLEYLLADEVLPLQEQTLALDRSADTWEDQGYMLLLLLLPLVLALFRRGWIACLLPALFAFQPQPSYAGFWDDLWLTPDQQGQRALERGDPQTAAGLFKDPDWVGTASYQGGDYEAAREAFSTNDNADGWYNRGNALAREGKLEQAIEAYRESLARMPEQADAEENIALLEQLQQQQQQQSGEGEQDQEQDQEQNQGSQQQDDGQQQRQEQNQDQGQSQDDRQQQQSQGDQQQRDSNQQSQQDQQQPGEQEKSAHQEQESPAEAGEQPQSESKQAQAQHAQADPEQQERDQAMEQWLRRVPDDPSGLLREKFRYESQQRQQQGVGRNDESYW